MRIDTSDDGYVGDYYGDWDYRIQKFSPMGTYITKLNINEMTVNVERPSPLDDEDIHGDSYVM